jgi:hypothetical protein
MGAARTTAPAFVAAALAALSGCSPNERSYVAHTSTNLALGRWPQQAQLAEQFTIRSNWPSVEGGYLFDDITYFSIQSYDRQSFYDRLGGEFDRESDTVRTGVLLR